MNAYLFEASHRWTDSPLIIISRLRSIDWKIVMFILKGIDPQKPIA